MLIGMIFGFSRIPLGVPKIPQELELNPKTCHIHSYCGWASEIRKTTNLRWLKPYKQWDNSTTYQLVITGFRNGPSTVNFSSKGRHLVLSRRMPVMSRSLGPCGGCRPAMGGKAKAIKLPFGDEIYHI